MRRQTFLTKSGRSGISCCQLRSSFDSLSSLRFPILPNFPFFGLSDLNCSFSLKIAYHLVEHASRMPIGTLLALYYV
jgi:hypothetical protein